MFDIYTTWAHLYSKIDPMPQPQDAIGLADGFTMGDMRVYEKNKVTREAQFPLSLVSQAFSLTLTGESPLTMR